MYSLILNKVEGSTFLTEFGVALASKDFLPEAFLAAAFSAEINREVAGFLSFQKVLSSERSSQ